MTATEGDVSAEERTEAARLALARAKYGWVWPLTGLNVIALIFAIIGGVGETNTFSFLFPQIWGFRFPIGAGIGVISASVVVAVAITASRRGVDRADRRYRFSAWLTLASTVMFAVFLGGMGALFLLLSTVAD